MGLNPQGRGAGRGNVVNFKPRGPHAGIGNAPMFRPIPPRMVCPAIPPEAQLGTSSRFGLPFGFTKKVPAVPRSTYRKFPPRNLRKSFASKFNGVPVPVIDMTKPWVTEEILKEDSKKQKLLEAWNESNESEDWGKYKKQKAIVQALYEKAKAVFAGNHPHEPALWETTIKHHYCETCDKSFRTDDDLLLHKAEHETCGRDGCEFTAHPKIIEKHIKMQHATGLYKRIGKLYTEEDIAKWIEERKKNYPTRKVIEEKKILEEEKQNRGERIKDDDSKFNKSFHSKNKRTGGKHFEKKSQRKNRKRKTKKNKKPTEVKCFEEEASTFRHGVPAFLGIKSTDEAEVPENKDLKDLDISDEDWEMNSKTGNDMKPVLNNSLGLLSTLYDSDAENQIEENHKEIKLEELSVDEGSGPEEVITVSSKNQLPEVNLSDERASLKRKLPNKKIRQDRKRKSVLNDTHSEKRSLTLLEKLLKNEIRHERNVILQCVHYVVKNNFLKS